MLFSYYILFGINKIMRLTFSPNGLYKVINSYLTFVPTCRKLYVTQVCRVVSRLMILRHH
nr:MAG TPA: hypothetical protein [Caudoviricetes sp.]